MVFRVVQREMFEVRGNDTAPSQPANETAHGFGMPVDQRPTCTTHARFNGKPVHRIFFEPIWGE